MKKAMPCPGGGFTLMSEARKGFTLIELLIVIAILGVLAAGVVTAINPLRRINQANDSKVKNDVGQIATAEQAYYTTNQVYVADPNALVTSGDLKVVPSAPSGYTAYSVSCSAGCLEVQVSGPLKAPAIVGNGVFCWKSASGTAIETTGCAP